MPPTPLAVVEQQVLDVVCSLVAELDGARLRVPVMDDLLDRDLGIGSLERVELLVRLERAFGFRLDDAIMAEAQSVRALAEAIANGAAVADGSAAPLETLPPQVGLTSSSALSPPQSARSLVDALRWHADRTPDRTHIYLRRDDGSEDVITYGRLLADATAVASGLRDGGVTKSEPVVLMLRTEYAFFAAFFGVLLAGAVPVPIYPPARADQILEYMRRQKAIVDNARARILVTFQDAQRMATLIRGQVSALDTITTVDALSAAGSVDDVRMADDAPALIQYTSGSTGTPKGVLLSHGNLLANIRAIGDGLAVDPLDVCVSWLPLYHDMGLIGAWLAPLYFGIPVCIMSPVSFLGRPVRWLRAIHVHRGTVSAAPNFAFDLAARKIADDELAGLDLTSWRLALNGSELVSADTIDRFSRRFAPYGFKPQAMCPVYGLAESSVGLTMSAPGTLPRVDRIARAPFERERALQEADDDDPRPLCFVACGRSLPGHDVRIVDESDMEVPDRHEGHIQFRGPSMTSGYYRNPEATSAIMHSGWMDSGDLGYRSDGDLFITGRAKDVIIQGGRNVSAQEVEEVVSAVPGIRRGCVAAFGVHDAAFGTERLVVVAETRQRDGRAREALQRAVVGHVVATLGTPPDIVVIVNPRSVPKTSSGKIRRSAARDAFVRGTLGQTESVTKQWIGLGAAWLKDALGRSWRRARHVAFTARVVLALLMTLPALWIYLSLVPPGRHARRAARRWSRLMVTLGGVRVSVTGLSHLDSLKSGVLAVNHASYVDPIVLMATLPLDFCFVAKRRLADYPIIGTVIRKGGHLSIEKSDVTQKLASADDVVARLQRGDVLVVFPEGTFDRHNRLLPFRLGSFKAAVEARCPVVPVALGGTREMLRDGSWLFRRADIAVTIGQPLQPEGSGWPEMVRLRDLTRDTIARAPVPRSSGP
jgi:1-acyl-sn-glycerol-3-phosphate acyltransferase